jgi:putative hemolysin
VAPAQALIEPLGFLGGAAEPVAVGAVTIALAFVTLVVGELAPKRLAVQRAERWGLLAARPLACLDALTRPVVWLLGTSSDLAVRLLGGDPSRQREQVTEDELAHLLAATSSFPPEQRSIISGAFEIGHRLVRQVLVPRRDVLAIQADCSAAEGLAALLASGHSGAPVVRGDLDDVVGVVNLRDLVLGGTTAGDLCHAAIALPEWAAAVHALRLLQAEHEQLAVVTNEYGGTQGIITIEDLIEELVGEICDETDPAALGAQHEDDGSLVLAGTFPLHALADLGVQVPEGYDATVAGLLLDRLGRIPTHQGDGVEVAGWILEPLEMKARAVTRVRLRHADGRERDGARSRGSI